MSELVETIHKVVSSSIAVLLSLLPLHLPMKMHRPLHLLLQEKPDFWEILYFDLNTEEDQLYSPHLYQHLAQRIAYNWMINGRALKNSFSTEVFLSLSHITCSDKKWIAVSWKALVTLHVSHQSLCIFWHVGDKSCKDICPSPCVDSQHRGNSTWNFLLVSLFCITFTHRNKGTVSISFVNNMLQR